MEPRPSDSRTGILKLQLPPPTRLAAEIPASLPGPHRAQATWSHRMELIGLDPNWERLLLLWGVEATRKTFKGTGRNEWTGSGGELRSYLQHVLLAARGRGDLVLAGVTEAPFGALPAHLGSGLPADHGPEDGVFPWGRKRWSKDWQVRGGVTVYLIEIPIYVTFTALGISTAQSKKAVGPWRPCLEGLQYPAESNSFQTMPARLLDRRA